jgi:eIF-2B alpha/beta/delta-like uncharacterized protein
MTDRPAQPPDPDRRRFFRRFAADVMSQAGGVLGAAQLLQQQSADAARELLALGEAEGAAAAVDGAAAPSGARDADVDASTAGYRAAFRWDGDVCRVVDQRRLPDVVAQFEVSGPADAVTAIKDGVLTGGPVEAQLGAIALALSADRIRQSLPFARRATIRGAANAVRQSRPGSAAMGAAMDRMLARFDAFGVSGDGDAIAAAMVDEAERIVLEATADHGSLVTHGLALLRELEGEAGADAAPLRVLTLGSSGAMAGGQAGTALGLLMAAHHGGRPVDVVVAEGRPGLEGARVAAWELAQAGVPYAVTTDAAASAIVAAREVALVVVAAERVAADGDVLAQAGTLALALAAREAGLPFLVCAPTTSLDRDLLVGAAAAVEEGRPGAVLRAAGTRVAPEGSPVRNPVQDRTPAALATALVTDEGVLRAPFEPSIAVAISRSDARRRSAPGFAAWLDAREAALAEAATAAGWPTGSGDGGAG